MLWGRVRVIQFSLLMCVYDKENPVHLTQCFESIRTQTVLPSELIVVKDGPLTDELEQILRNLRFPNELKIIALPENMTQGPARAEGLKAAKHEWVAIMDSDDICVHDRFEKQLKMIADNPELGLIGGQISEFTENPEHIAAKRLVPTEHNEIVTFAKKRNPLNQMTVMLKRDLAISAGNYRYFPWFEDYDLWSRMIKNGAVCANHPDVLVNARIGSGMYARRRGISYIRSEWRMQRQLRQLGFIDSIRFIRNTALRIPIRLLPQKGIEAVYRRYVRC